jgi:hypothetical protein
MAGMPSSRAMLAAWHVRPPLFMTMPPAFFMTELHLLVLEATVVAVGDGAGCEKGREDEVHPVLQVLVAHDVEVGLLLTREGGVQQVLGSGGGAHREGEGLAAAAHALPLLLELLLEVLLEWRVHDLVADGLADLQSVVAETLSLKANDFVPRPA